MPGAFLNNKLKRGFDFLDTNGDQVLDLGDFSEAGDRISDAFGCARSSPEGVKMRASWETMWREIVEPLDHDRDGRVTFEEFSSAVGDRMAGDPDGYSRMAKPCLDVIFDLGDRDHDGKLTAEEFALAFRAIFGLTEAAVAQAFPHLDTDHDGSITRAELHQAVAQYWAGDDETVDGNWLLGPM